jgi:hypothetical protein
VRDSGKFNFRISFMHPSLKLVIRTQKHFFDESVRAMIPLRFRPPIAAGPAASRTAAFRIKRRWKIQNTTRCGIPGSVRRSSHAM